MNKLLGFYELKDSSLPTIPWEKYSTDTLFSSDILWTVRSAVHWGNDLNLPRSVGVNAEEARDFALKTSQMLGNNGMVIYYPYFVAEKSGTLNVFGDRVVIEAVKDDLWNLVTYQNKEVTVIIQNNIINYIGNREFLKESEIKELQSYVNEVKRMFRDDLTVGKSILLEWSYAYNCDRQKNRIGERYLVFYEVRTV